MTHNELNLIERARALFNAAESEKEPELRALLFLRHRQIAMRAIKLQMERKQNTLMAVGSSPTA